MTLIDFGAELRFGRFIKHAEMFSLQIRTRVDDDGRGVSALAKGNNLFALEKPSARAEFRCLSET